MKRGMVGLLAAVLLLAVGFGLVGLAPVTAAPVAQDAATFQLVPKVSAVRTIFETAQVSGTTTYSSGTYSVTTGYGSADVFLVGDLTGTAYLTATVQVSGDGVNWADADYEYATDSTIATKTHTRSLSADGTEYMTVKLAGSYLRVKIEATGQTTTTVQALYRGQ